MLLSQSQSIYISLLVQKQFIYVCLAKFDSNGIPCQIWHTECHSQANVNKLKIEKNKWTNKQRKEAIKIRPKKAQK